MLYKEIDDFDDDQIVDFSKNLLNILNKCKIPYMKYDRTSFFPPFIQIYKNINFISSGSYFIYTSHDDYFYIRGISYKNDDKVFKIDGIDGLIEFLKNNVINYATRS